MLGFVGSLCVLSTNHSMLPFVQFVCALPHQRFCCRLTQCFPSCLHISFLECVFKMCLPFFPRLAQIPFDFCLTVHLQLLLFLCHHHCLLVHIQLECEYWGQMVWYYMLSSYRSSLHQCLAQHCFFYPASDSCVCPACSYMLCFLVLLPVEQGH